MVLVGLITAMHYQLFKNHYNFNKNTYLLKLFTLIVDINNFLDVI